tara:strand:+ start:877 stop:1245 length:369 start_codon:yes stop_codon:yes gene_type:complete
VKQLEKKAESAIDAINNSKVMERLQQNVLDTTYRFISKKPAQLNQDEKELVMIFFGDTQFYQSNPVKQKMEEIHELVQYLLKDVIVRLLEYIQKDQKVQKHNDDKLKSNLGKYLIDIKKDLQ